MLLYMASRAQLVEQVIRPALTAGKIVISDRYLLANVVYQAHAGGLNPADVWQVGQVTVAGIMPRLIFLLDMPAELAARRIQRAPDRMEAQGLGYLEQVRQGFLTEARKRPGRNRRARRRTGRLKPFTPMSCAKSSERWPKNLRPSAARRG